MANYTLTTDNDNLEGTAGDDVFTVPSNNANLVAADVISGGAGRDTLLFSRTGAVSVSADRLAGLDSIEVLDFSASASLLLSLGEATLAQSGLTSTVTGGRVLDVITGGGPTNLDLRGTDPQSDSLARLLGGGVVTLFDAVQQWLATGGTSAATVIGGSGQDWLFSGVTGDHLSGGAGHDVLTSGAGRVTLTGGADIDRFVIMPGSTTTIADFAGAAAFERIDLRAFAGLDFAGLTLVEQNGSTFVTLPRSNTTVLVQNVLPAALSAADFLFDGADTPFVFTLTTGADTFTGGAADDLFDVSGNIAALDATMDSIDGGAGIDTLRIFGADRSLGTSRLDAMRSIEVIDLTNTTGANLATITAAHVATSDTGNILLRHGSADLLLDTSLVGKAADVVVEGTGTVTLGNIPGQKVTISDAVAGHVVGGNGVVEIRGGALADLIEGGRLDDVLVGGAGSDTLYGHDGNDTLSGGTGDDILVGGAGDNRLIGGAGKDVMTGGAGDDIFVIASSGATTIIDFETNNRLERIDLTSVAGLDFSGLTIRAVGQDLLITGSGVDLTLTGATDIDATDFLFAGQDPLIFKVGPDIAMSDLQHLLDAAPAGAEIHFAAGTYNVTQTLEINRSDISLIGAGEGKTIFYNMIPDTSVGPVIKAQYVDYPIRYGAIVEDAAAGSYQVILADGHDVQAGDLLYVGQPNDDEWLTATGNAGWVPPGAEDSENVDDPSNAEEYWLREVRSEVVAVDGNTITLRDPLPYSFQARIAQVQESVFLSNVNLSGFTIQGRWGKADANDFTVTIEPWEGRSTLELDGVRDSAISDISIIDSPSHAFRLQRLYAVTGDHLTTNGAHNKDGGNGYGYLVYESFALDFTNITSIDNRHALLFSSFSAEHYNSFHLLYTNRGINFHGSPDADNTVVVDVMRQEYPAGSTPQFDAVQGGSFPLHPYWTIEANDVTFRDAVTAERNDIVHAHVDGGRLSTGLGNDRLFGGPGNDILDGGENGDIMTGGGGRDQFLRQNADFTDTITDFETGVRGDIMVLIGSAYRRFSELQLVQQGNDVLLMFGTNKGHTRFQNTRVADFVAENFVFRSDNMPGETFTLRASDTLVVGSDKHDTFVITANQIANPAFVAIGGTGLDTLAIIQNVGTLSGMLHDMGKISGIETFDISGVRNANVSVSNVTAAQSDTQRLTLAVGDDTSANPVTLQVNALGSGRTISIDGSRAVQLTDGQRHTVKSTDRIGTDITGGDQIDIIWGGRAHDTLRGGAGNDTIFGVAGDDWIDGGAGADIMNGGPGSDTYIIDNIGDRVAESRRWEGVDHVISSVDFLMGRQHIENLTLTGTANIRGIGNGLENTIIGNSGNNIIDGGPRNDYMAGGAGNDTYYVRDAGDIVVELANEGTDTVNSFLSYQLPEHVEILRLIGEANINGIGNALNNTIIGNAKNNVIDGGEGRDTLTGGAGADTFRFTTAPSVTNVDTITDFTLGVDRIALLGSVFGGHAHGALTAAAFQIGTVALEADDRVIFDPATGRLWYDADGAGGAAQQLFAVISGTVSSDSFLFI